MEEFKEFCADSFCGSTRLFPLPGLVMFPHVVQALHIFEPRYRELLAEAMATDRLISTAVLLPGWEADYEAAPPVASVVCLGQVISRTLLPDGCSNILLLGLTRARILREVPQPRPFRKAEVELLRDQYGPLDDAARNRLKQQLFAAFQELLPHAALASDQLTQSLGAHIGLSTLTDLLAYSLQLDVPSKQQLLATLQVEQRAKMLLQHLARLPQRTDAENQRHGGFPPPFSLN